MNILRYTLICSVLVIIVLASASGAGSMTVQDTVHKKPARPSTASKAIKPSANYGTYAFTMRSLDGVKVRLNDYAGKIVLVTIWSPGCEPCERETDALVKIYNRFHGSGLNILGVAVKTTETDVRAFLQKHGVKWTVGIDDEIMASYGMYGLPDHYLFGADGSLLKHYIGMLREDIIRPTLDDIFRKKPAVSRPPK